MNEETFRHNADSEDAREPSFIDRLKKDVPEHMKVGNIESYEIVAGLLSREELHEYLDVLKEHHYDSFEHSIRDAVLAVDLGFENDISEEELELLGIAGLLHDLGKQKVESDILNKPAKPSEEELAALDDHPRIGFRLLSDPLFENVKNIVVGHHEWQKRPYPREGEDGRDEIERRENVRSQEDRRSRTDRREVDETIQRLTQILAVADIYESLASKRAYKEPLTKDEIEKILRAEFTGDPQYIIQVLRRHGG